MLNMHGLILYLLKIWQYSCASSKTMSQSCWIYRHVVCAF